MKKHLLALAALATVSGVAVAQSATVYGILDTSIVVNNNSTGGAKKTSLESGNWLPSLFGITGTEDLGGGLKANFKLEANLNTDTGAAGKDIAGGPAAGGLFDRQAWVGLSGSFGEFRAGKQIDALFLQSFLNNVRLSHANSAAVIGGLGVGRTWDGTIFSANTVSYTTPSYNGAKLTAQYQFGEQAGNNSAGKGVAFLVNYDGIKDLSLSLGQKNDNHGTTGADLLETNLVGAVYKLGAFQLNAQFNQYKYKATGQKTNLQEFGVGYAISPALTAAVNYVDYENTTSAGVKQTSDVTSVSLKYALSKRTSVYTMASRADKVTNSGSALPATPAYLSSQGLATKAATGYSFGVTHTF